jgi:hypothetical protein
MIYAEFYHRTSTGFQAACGDRSVIILDGRTSKAAQGAIAAAECRKRGYAAWRIFKGESFTRSAAISQLWPVVCENPVSNPSWLSAYGM